MITTGFAPYEFSEAIVNSKLVLALKMAGHEIDVISRESQQVYATGWSKIWGPLKDSTYFVSDIKVSKFRRLIEIIYSLFFFKYPINGIRWGYKVYKLALKLNKDKQYDILLTRMPSNIPHLIGKKINEKLNIPWIANWNDPTDNIRPLLEDNDILKTLINNLLVKAVFHHAIINSFPSRELWEHFNGWILHSDCTNVEIIPHIGFELQSGSQINSPENTEFTMCHAGNMWSNVNSKPFLQALIKIKQVDKRNFKLHVFGSINKSFPELINEYKLEENIYCHEPLGYEAMISELQRYDVLVLLEAQYEKGILLLSKLSDYASVGKPVFCISPKIGVIPDYIKRFGGGITVNNKDPNSIYEGLKILINEWDNQWPQKNISSSKNLYEQFCPSRIVTKYEKLFDKISVPN